MEDCSFVRSTGVMILGFWTPCLLSECTDLYNLLSFMHPSIYPCLLTSIHHSLFSSLQPYLCISFPIFSCLHQLARLSVVPLLSFALYILLWTHLTIYYELYGFLGSAFAWLFGTLFPDLVSVPQSTIPLWQKLSLFVVQGEIQTPLHTGECIVCGSVDLVLFHCNDQIPKRKNWQGKDSL